METRRSARMKGRGKGTLREGWRRRRGRRREGGTDGIRVSRPRGAEPLPWKGRPVDLVLSSGFLAFAYHVGFLEAVLGSDGMAVRGIMGTSAGALTGSLLAAGYETEAIAEELSRVAPMQLLRPSRRLRNGMLSLEMVVERLERILPPRFEDLEREFAVGVVGSDGRHHLIHRGPLAPAVAASAAIPGLFEPVHVQGFHCNPCSDGGIVDRIGLKQWRAHRRNKGDTIHPALVHVIGRSSPFSGDDDVERMGEEDILVVNSPKSGQSLVSLGDFEDQRRMAYERTLLALELEWCDDIPNTPNFS